jgi:hypothetical protein
MTRRSNEFRDSMCHMKMARFLSVFSFVLLLLPLPAFASEW